MKTNFLASRLALALLAATCLPAFAGTAPAAARDVATPDAAAMWADYLAHGDYEKSGDLGVFDEVDYDGRSVDADKCRAQAAQVREVVAVLPVSIAARRLAFLCAEATGDEATAERELAVLAALSRYALKQAGDPAVAAPIRVMIPADVYSLIYSSGMVPGSDYYPYLTPLRFFPHVVAAVDEKTGNERHLAFDYVDPSFQMLSGKYPYPITRTWLANAFVRGAAEADLLAAVDLAALQAGRLAGPADRVAKLRGAAARGGLQSAEGWLLMCATRKTEHCSESLPDSLLSLAESKEALPMVLLAYAYIDGVGVTADPKAGWALLDAADRRWSDAGALVKFASLWISVHDHGRFPPEFQKRLDAAAERGVRAARRVQVRQHLDTGMSQADIDFLSAPEENALGRGYAVLARHYFTGPTKDEAKAWEWTRKAAQAGDPEAQGELAVALYGGHRPGIARDVAQALALAKLGAHGGSRSAALVMGMESAQQGDYAASEGWMLAPAADGDTTALLGLAELYSEERPGVTEKLPRAIEILEELAGTTEAGPRARRQLAQLAKEGRGMPKDLARARQWVLADAEANDKDAQLFLAGTYLMPDEGKPDETQGLRWLQRAIDNGSDMAVVQYASWLYYDRNTAQSRSQAVAMLDKAATAGNSGAINNYAWILCTSPLPEQYDPKRGMALIGKLGSFDRARPGPTDTLAACHAANGDFATAVKLQEVAARQLRAAEAPEDAAKRGNRTAGYERRLALYKAGKRYQEFERNQ